jgi:hypothetical protein
VIYLNAVKSKIVANLSVPLLQIIPNELGENWVCLDTTKLFDDENFRNRMSIENIDSPLLKLAMISPSPSSTNG